MPFTREQLESMAEIRSSSPIPPFCTGCGYDLTGAVSDRCPECGKVFIRKEWQQCAAQLKQQLRELQEAGQWVRIGLWTVGGGAVVAFAGLFARDGCLKIVLHGVAGISAFVGISLALNLFRTGRLPPWVRDQMGVLRRYSVPAVVTIILGVGVLALAIFAP